MNNPTSVDDLFADPPTPEPEPRPTHPLIVDHRNVTDTLGSYLIELGPIVVTCQLGDFEKSRVKYGDFSDDDDSISVVYLWIQEFPDGYPNAPAPPGEILLTLELSDRWAKQINKQKQVALKLLRLTGAPAIEVVTDYGDYKMTARSSLEPWNGQQSIGRKATAFFDQHEAPAIARQLYNHLILNYFVDESSRVTATAQTLAYEMGYQDRKTVYPGSRWLIKNGVMKEERRVIGRGGYVEMSFVVPEKWPWS